MKRGMTVAEVTWCNSISVSEHAVMQILSLVRNYIPSYKWVIDKGWNIADCVARSYDVEGMNVGTVAAGRIGLAVLRRLKPFDVKLHYADRHRLPSSVESELNLTYHPNVESLVKVCDVVSIHCPLHPETEGMFNDALLAKMKRGSYIVNTARGPRFATAMRSCGAAKRAVSGIRRRRVVPATAAEGSPLANDAPHGMTPHTSARRCRPRPAMPPAREILECWFENAHPQRVSDRRWRKTRREPERIRIA